MKLNTKIKHLDVYFWCLISLKVLVLWYSFEKAAELMHSSTCGKLQ